MTPFYITPSVATPEDWKSVFRFDVQKRPLGSVLEKTCSEVCFCRGIPGVLDSTTWAEDKKYCWKRRQTRKIELLLRICLFAWGIALLWIWSSGQTRNTLAKLRILVKFTYFPGILRCYFVVTVDFQGRFLALTNWQAGIHSELVNRSFLINN